MVDAALMELAFGHSSSDDADNGEGHVEQTGPSEIGDKEHCHSFSTVFRTIRSTIVPGLIQVQSCVEESLQDHLLDSMSELGWLDNPKSNQALCFGAMPAWLDPAVACIPPDAMPPEFAQREPRFDHMLVNIYEPGEGLNQHVDLLRFEDGIISISLSSACVMVFTHIRSRAEVPILLEPGDVLCMHGPARYEWTHGIPARLSDEWEGRTLERERRVSITLRRMRPDGWTLQD
eukprot:CAMPEP_0114233316 /NCGR_PEP_ID=MMETSP0058-20121206/5095_1 /TAXON_ID=36894 /ORGANISM="Pyramimonas parkeae, CCMP726" /LENGTH=232 /DNA_ID=CAMNT_0001344889 /DNA_START=285 /DNA_END=983 /DNA_ORIENTATION=+